MTVDDAGDLYRSVEAFRTRAYARVGEDRLPRHLEQTYGIEVAATSTLEGGVIKIDRITGPSWVARLFPLARPIQAVAGDAEILQFVEKQGFPAERCVPDPVSEFEGQGVLVTEFVAGANARGNRSPQLMPRLGALLGQLHTLPAEPGATERPAGSWHSLSLHGGSRSEDVVVLTSLLADAKIRAPSQEQPQFDSVCEELLSLDVGDGLPTALTHPDFCSANVITTPEDEIVLVDWTSAGSAPRICALGWLLSTTGGDASAINAVVSEYRKSVRLEDDELARLDDSVRAFGFILACWGVVVRGAPPARVLEQVARGRDAAAKIGALAREAFKA